MDPSKAKALKASQKKAGRALQEKNFDEALNLLKPILEAEPENVIALIFYGKACDGTGKKTEALQSYTKAVELQPSNLLAWQGLSSFYEAHENQQDLTKMATAYRTQLTLMPNEDQLAKYKATCEKLIRVYQKLKDDKEIADVHLTLLHRLPAEEVADYCHVWSNFVQASLGELNVTSSPYQKIKEVYAYLLERVSGDKLEATWTSYIQWLAEQQDKMEEVKDQCEAMGSIIPSSTFPWLFLQQIWLEKNTASPLEADMTMYISDDSLARLPQNSPLCYTLNAIQQLQAGHGAEAKKLALEGVQAAGPINGKNLCTWAIYAQCAAQVKDYGAAIKVGKAVLALLDDPRKSIKLYGGSTDKLHSVILLLLAQSLLKEQHTKEALQLIDKQTDLCADLLTIKLTCLIEEKELERMAEVLESADTKALFSAAQHLGWSGWLAYNKGDKETARQRFEQSLAKDNKQALVQHRLGKVYWDCGKPQQALNYFLTAARLDSQNSESFYYIGLYYNVHTADKGKAIKCLQRAFDLDPTSEQVGTVLVDALMNRNEVDRCLSILESVTSIASAGSCKWGWLRLGLAQLRVDTDPSAAIKSLKAALRADPNDPHVLECLGEAYMKRGGYAAALKVFTKASELNPGSLYSFYQLASMEQLVGEYTAAVKAYDEVLAMEGGKEHIPSLIGMGQSLLMLARGAIEDFFHGRAVDYCQKAVHYLTRSAVLRPDMSCPWKLLGDVFSVLYKVPEELARLSVSSVLRSSGGQGDSVGEEKLGKADLLSLAVQSYAMALKQQPNSSSLWQDLGMSYWREGKASKLPTCIQCLHKAVSLSPNNHHLWLALGTIVAQKQVNNKALAQHCYIKSIQLEPSNVMAWTYLGVLYMSENHIHAANEAFSIAQATVPDNVQCWLGQAMVAERVGQHMEAMDLFRHCTQLDNHVEGSIGFAHWVVDILQDPAKMADDFIKYVIHDMHAVQCASDALTKYVDRVRDDPTAYTLLGLLLEKQGLHGQSCEMFSSALSLLDKQRDADPSRVAAARANYARSLRECANYEEAMKQYETLILSGHSCIGDEYGRALTYIKQKEFAKAYAVYAGVCKLSAHEADLGELHTAMGMLAYCMGEKDQAIANFTQSPVKNKECLMALNALYMLMGDLQQSATFISELRSRFIHTLEEKRLVDKDVLYLSALHSFMQNDFSQAFEQLDSAPSRLWEQTVALVSTIPELFPEFPPGVPEHATPGVATAIWDLARGYHHRCTPLAGSKGNAFREALKAAHANPESLASWLCVVACGHAELIIRGSFNPSKEYNHSNALFAESMRSICADVLSRVERELGESRAAGENRRHHAWLETVYVWCSKHYIIALFGAERKMEAENFLNTAMWMYENDLFLKSMLAFIKESPSGVHELAIKDAHCYQMLMDMYVKQENNDKVLNTLEEWSREPKERACASMRKLHWSATRLKSGDPEWQALVDEVKNLEGGPSTAAHFILVQVANSSNNTRLVRHHLKELLKQPYCEGDLEFCRSMARQQLYPVYQQQQATEEAFKEVMDQAKEEHDDAFLSMYASQPQED